MKPGVVKDCLTLLMAMSLVFSNKLCRSHRSAKLQLLPRRLLHLLLVRSCPVVLKLPRIWQHVTGALRSEQ
jgi:hypothetical protein